jgi:DNA-binding IclR family transcriptional regulator
LYVNKLAFAAGEQWITITVPELSKALERPVSKVRRGLKKAVERGWVVREDIENGFRLSMRDSIPNDSPKT